jgi:radical SAM protein with 4Fe4S-binding SPASM domain
MVDTGWIDGFIKRIRPYVRVRLTDNVVIRMPNEAFKVNRTGARALKHLLDGGKVADILRARNGDPDTAAELNFFFSDLARMLSGGICENYSSPALERSTFELGYIELPVLSEVALTDSCNLKCEFCYAACAHVCGIRGDAAHSSMTTGQVKDVLRIIREEAEVPSVSFTGGEPTLRKDLAELIAYAVSLDMRVNLITNGTLIDENKAREYKQAGLASAQVSIESPDEEIHDRIVGVERAFRRSVAGLKALRDAGIHVHPHSTICKPNAETIPGMAALAEELGIKRFSANLVIPSGRGDDDRLAVSYSEIGSLVEEIAEVAKRRRVRFMWYSPTPICLFNPLAHGMGNKGCSACEGLLSVDSLGRLLPCSSWDEPLGSLLEEGFEQLWHSARSRFIREKREAHPGCRACEHFALCHGACPLYFNVHGHAEIEPCLEKVRKEAAV